jgi:thiol-disulfide isomerase/thioredoxin
MKLSLSMIAGVCLIAASASRAADLGDPAADLKIKKWIKGEPVEIAAGDKNIYVVEFWATWCGPCRTSIPHLTELQKKFKDKNVIFIGVSDEKEGVVRDFVQQMGSKMDYRVVIDDSRKTSAGYMEKYEIGGIPHAFVVQNKKVLWQGHPMDRLEETLEKVTSGKYDLAAEKKKLKASALLGEFAEAVSEGKNDRADELEKELLAMSQDLKDIVPGGEFKPAEFRKQIRTRALMQQYFQALMAEEKDEAEKTRQELKTLSPDADLAPLEARAEMARLHQQYFEALSTSGTKAKADAEKLGPSLAGKLKGEPQMANEVAWNILTSDEVKYRDTALALQIARQACEDSKWEDGTILDTYARALFDTGKKKEAIEYQEKAIANAPSEIKKDLQETLERYKQGKSE